MRVEVLSDHGGQQLRRTEQRLQDAGANLAASESRYREAQNHLQDARRGKPL